MPYTDIVVKLTNADHSAFATLKAAYNMLQGRGEENLSHSLFEEVLRDYDGDYSSLLQIVSKYATIEEV